MASERLFYGFVDSDGRLCLKDQRAYEQHIRALREKGTVTITVTLGRKKASVKQFGWYRGIALPILAEHLGYDKHEINDLHDNVLIACYGSTADKMTGREVPAHRTRDSDTKEMAEFQDWFCRYCAMEHGVVVPMPNERIEERDDALRDQNS